MKFRRIITLTLALSMFGTVSVFADSIGQQIRVIINNREASDPGLIVDGKTMLSLREMAESLHALIAWNEEAKKVQIIKPNVHMFLIDAEKDKIFNEVERGKADFIFIAQTDNLLADVYSFRVTITDPYGKVTDIVPETIFTDQKDTYNTRSKEMSYDFRFTGKYTIDYQMKLTRNHDYQTVSQKVITSRSLK
ncbi:hypothetical protein SY83_15310 [Paenibacillus swuensis]|uniref:Copper amine oxidase-like N-terminal domain-containing protein n=1 Tax=Paenibacillus swuensis TaxID=1178515 RepID=A0A172TKG5_9BACL|nr:stalk domain-containing protein [Paenibacillus swuensis]ANE47414.1 hypothetical protein SY83_15310 [Paenibacillus swuensis]